MATSIRGEEVVGFVNVRVSERRERFVLGPVILVSLHTTVVGTNN